MYLSTAFPPSVFSLPCHQWVLSGHPPLPLAVSPGTPPGPSWCTSWWTASPRWRSWRRPPSTTSAAWSGRLQRPSEAGPLPDRHTDSDGNGPDVTAHTPGAVGQICIHRNKYKQGQSFQLFQILAEALLGSKDELTNLGRPTLTCARIPSG